MWTPCDSPFLSSWLKIRLIWHFIYQSMLYIYCDSIHATLTTRKETIMSIQKRSFHGGKVINYYIWFRLFSWRWHISVQVTKW